MPDYAKFSQNYQEAKTARLNSGSPFKSKTEIDLKKSAEQAMLDDIGQRYKAKIVVKIEKHQDYLAFGKPDMSYPGKVVIAEEGRATVFDATNLGASTRTNLTRSEGDLAVFHYGDKRFAKTLSEDYDHQDAIDDFTIGLQRHYWKLESRLMAGYNNDSFTLEKNEKVSEDYRTVHKWAKETGWTDARDEAKIQAERLIKERGLVPKEIWPLKNDVRGEILVINTIRNDEYSEENNAILAISFPDGSYQLQKDHMATQLEVGKMLEFKTNNRGGFEKREITDKVYYLSQETNGLWAFHFEPNPERQNYGPFANLDITWDVLDIGNIEEHAYELTPDEKMRLKPASKNLDEIDRSQSKRSMNDEYYDALIATKFLEPSKESSRYR